MKLQVGVKLLLKNQKNQYLLLQRSEPLPDGTGIKWDIPGGRINDSESLEEALQRELTEEIGIKLVILPKLLKAQDIFVPDIELHVVRITYVVNLTQEAVNLSNEHQNYTWASIEDALQFNVDPYLHTVLQELHAV